MFPPPPPPPPPHFPQNPNQLEANGRFETKPETPTVIVMLNVVNTVTQLFLGAVVFCAFSLANIFTYANTFSQHIYLCVTGYAILMSQAILSMNTQAGWANSLKYPEKRIIHGIMQVLGSTLAIVGAIVRIVDWDDHFNTAHSITGLIATLLTILSLIGGILNFIYPANTSTVTIKSMHACLGSLTITVAFICICLGFNDWYRYLFGNINANIAITFTVFALAGILTSASANTTRRMIAHQY